MNDWTTSYGPEDGEFRWKKINVLLAASRVQLMNAVASMQDKAADRDEPSKIVVRDFLARF